MNLFSKLPGKLTRFAGNLFLKTKKASPEIFVIGGVLCGGAAIVMAGVRTYKKKEIIESDLDAIRQYTTNFKEVDAVDLNHMSEKEKNKLIVVEGKPVEKVKVSYKDLTEEQKKELWARRIDFGKDILKIYWLPGVLAFSSAGLIWGGRTILRKELSATTAAYAALLETYRKYRERVANEIGEEKEQQLAGGYKIVDQVDAETGKVEKAVIVDPQANLSQYSFWFDEGYFDKETGQWAWRNFTHDQNKLQNRLKVIELEGKYTRRLRTIGYCWLEDLALDFGIDPDEAKKFHDIGWVWKEGDENRVELGVLETKWQLPVNKGFCDDSCSQNKCLINPNVDGYIGYVRDNFKKYDMRYGFGKKQYQSLNREINATVQRYEKEKMEGMVLNAMSPKSRLKFL